MAMDRDGFIHDGKEHGFLCFETRFVSRYEIRINGEHPTPNTLSNVEQHTWLGYYTYWSPSFGVAELADEGSGAMSAESEWPLELRVSRYVGDGLHEDLDLTNFTGRRISFELALHVDADFADQAETGGRRRQEGKHSVRWHGSAKGSEPEPIGESSPQSSPDQSETLEFRYEAENHFSHQDFSGYSRIRRGLKVSFHDFDSPPRYEEGRVTFLIELEPHGKWHTCVDLIPIIEARELNPKYGCHSFSQIKSKYDELRHAFTEDARGTTRDCEL